MLTSVTSLILALMAALGTVRMSVLPGEEMTAYDDVHRSEANPSGAYAAVANVSCDAGVPHLHFTSQSIGDPLAVTHELLHALDCADNAVFDGSPDPTACAEVPTDCLHSWVYWAIRNQEEAAAYIGRLQPPRHLAPEHEPIVFP